jgi:hypothetical protein
MSDRPTAVNGKRNQAWGTTAACPACGECLCFGCHPHGPCVDEQDHAASIPGNTAFASGGLALGAWSFTSEGSVGVAGLHLRSH